MWRNRHYRNKSMHLIWSSGFWLCYIPVPWWSRPCPSQTIPLSFSADGRSCLLSCKQSWLVTMTEHDQSHLISWHPQVSCNSSPYYLSIKERSHYYQILSFWFESAINQTPTSCIASGHSSYWVMRLEWSMLKLDANQQTTRQSKNNISHIRVGTCVR